MEHKNEDQEEQKHEEEKVDFNKPAFLFKPNEYHTWRQQGPYLICKSCELTHAVWIGVEKVMVGIEKDGIPILKARNSIPR